MTDSTPIGPDANKAKPGRPRKSEDASRRTQRIDPADLVPNLEALQASVSQHYKYWIGAMPGCPVEYVVLGGECFSKVTEEIVRDRMGDTQRIPRIGQVVELNRQKLERIAEKLSRTIIRFTKDEGTKEEPGTGQNLGDLHIRPRKGFLITIPTPDEMRLRAEKGLPTGAYQQQAGDEPAARYLFCSLCPDQERGGHGESYPHPISEVGLEWPGETE